MKFIRTNSKDYFENKAYLKDLINRFKDWYSFIRTKYRVIILFVLIGCTCGYIYASLQKQMYKAELTFILEGDNNGNNGFGGAANSIGIDIGGSSNNIFVGQNLIELMGSRYLIEKSLLTPVFVNNETISLAEYYIQINSLRTKWGSALKNIYFSPNESRNNYTIQKNEVLYNIYGNLVSSKYLFIGQKDKKNSILSIEVTNENEEFAKLFCEALVKETVTFYVETKSKKTKLNIEILKKQIDSLRIELNNSISEVASGNDEVFNINASLNRIKTKISKKQLDVQLNNTLLLQLIGQVEAAKITLRKEMPLIQIIDKPILPLEINNISKLFFLIIGGLSAAIMSLIYITIVKEYVNYI